MPEVHVLEILRGDHAGKEFALSPTESRIAGRSGDVDLVLSDDTVSRKHARFFYRRGYAWVVDLHSRNGTHVNGEPVERHRLLPGDRVRIGANLMGVVMRDASAAARSGTWPGKRRRGEDTGSGRSMRGSLEDIPLVDVLQWLASSRKTGTLKLHEPDGTASGSLILREGHVCSARIEGSSGLAPKKALIRMMRWSRGVFELDAEVDADVEDEIETSLEHMLMEAARQQDELEALAAKATFPERTHEIRMVHPAPVRWRELAPELIDMLQDVAEHRRWGEILDSAATDDLAATRAIVELAKRGVVEWDAN